MSNFKKPNEWYETNLRLNKEHVLTIGERVLDHSGQSATVTAIQDWSENGPLTAENHGTITI